MLKELDRKLIINVREIPPREARYADFPKGLHNALIIGLNKKGIKKLYSHQAESMEHVLAGRNLIITTGTSSGKSLVYILPILNLILNNSLCTALYLSPAKALSQNQYQSIREFCETINWPGSPPIISVCDGDTPWGERKGILNQSNIVFSTPDFWHSTGMPGHAHWNILFRNLQYVIIDEAHMYRGSLGNHVSHVLRRLRRICAYYKSFPQFILCSATIANAEEFARNLTGLDFILIDKEGSYTAKKSFVFMNPPEYRDKVTNQLKRRLTHYEAVRIMGTYVRAGRRVINFGRSKQVVESTYRKLVETYPDISQKVRPYKGTLTPEMRRNIEEKLFNGVLKGIVSTNALELGVDIGDLDVCIMSGFPGSISSVWQQVGRVGRRGKESLALLIAGDDPLDQFLVKKPDYFFARPCEKAVVNPQNLSFLTEHLLMAARELPISILDREYWGKSLDKAVVLLRDNRLFKMQMVHGQKTYLLNRRVPVFSLRGDSPTYIIRTEMGKVIGRTTYDDVLVQHYPGAVFLQMGKQYRVKRINVDSKEIVVEECSYSWQNKRTRPTVRVDVSIKQVEEARAVKAFSIATGILCIERRTVSFSIYESRAGRGEKKVAVQPVSLPSIDLETVGIWVKIPNKLVERLGKNLLEQALHGVEHLLRVVLPWKVMCERSDIGAHLAINFEDGAALFLYDIYPGGVGYCEAAFEIIEDILNDALNIIESCSCKSGCPSCIHIPQCEQRNADLDKEAARDLLLLMLGRGTKKETSFVQRTIAAAGNVFDRAGLRLAARRREKEKLHKTERLKKL
ncbi:DEAD/DEAH box helicase [Desulfolucanica intricata]|uniref:DEAD/DEAH box helicase n=1 Tax=Desulfolucanica intricata TaxID=1285191 RepID=UPI000835C181|nr:DEAD/DEAH box helicase [Desulfolucanica intricata]